MSETYINMAKFTKIVYKKYSHTYKNLHKLLYTKHLRDKTNRNSYVQKDANIMVLQI